MPLATKNNAIIVTGGKLAENCGCCGGWYCDTIYGACVVNGVCTSKCESECAAAGGTFHGSGSGCCSSVTSQFLNSAMPKTILLSFSGVKPRAYGHGCGAYPSGTTVDMTYDNSSGWTPLDVFGTNIWPSTITLTRDGSGATYTSYGWNGAATMYDAPSSAGATIACSHIASTGLVAWSVASVGVESWSRRKCLGRGSPSEFNPDGFDGISSALVWNLSATCSGNSIDGISLPSQSVASSNSFSLGVADQFRPQPLFCNLDISQWVISGISFTY